MLPNITGEVGFYGGPWGTNSQTGALYNNGRSGAQDSGGAGDDAIRLGFNAQHSNAIYGKSNVVQPDAAQILTIIKI